MKTHKQRVGIVRNYLSTAITLSDDGQQSFQYLLLGTDEFHATDAFDDLNCACNNGDVEEIADAVYNVLLNRERFQPRNPELRPPIHGASVSMFEDDALAVSEICNNG